MQILLHPADQPVFRLCGSAAQCGIEIRINDVPVLREHSGQAHSFDLAINEWLFQGLNPIDIHLQSPEPGSSIPDLASFELKVIYKPARGTVRSQSEIGEFSWRPDPAPELEIAARLHVPADSEESELIEEPPLLALPGQAEDLQWCPRTPRLQSDKSLRITSTLPLPPPWPVCPWLRGTRHAAHAGTTQVISGRLRMLHQTLIQGIWPEMFKHRRAAIQAAYYLGGDEADDALGFPRLLNQKAWKLQPLPTTPFHLELAGQGRLARLLDPATGESPLILVNETSQLSALVDAWWMFTNEWLLVR